MLRSISEAKFYVKALARVQDEVHVWHLVVILKLSN